MGFEDRLRAYVEHVTAGGDPLAPAEPLGDADHEVWVSWRDDEDIHVEIRVNDERYGYFVNGRRTEPSWEGGVDGPDVTQWNGVREF
jgi:hypothetical protein